mgnify:CR=1 FL=1
MEVEEWLRRHGGDLIDRAAAARPVVDDARSAARARNPKRAQREAPGRHANRAAAPRPGRPWRRTWRPWRRTGCRTAPSDVVRSARRSGRNDAHDPGRATGVGESAHRTNRSRAGTGPISARNRTDLDAEPNRSRRGTEPISATWAERARGRRTRTPDTRPRRPTAFRTSFHSMDLHDPHAWIGRGDWTAPPDSAPRAPTGH